MRKKETEELEGYEEYLETHREGGYKKKKITAKKVFEFFVLATVAVMLVSVFLLDLSGGNPKAVKEFIVSGGADPAAEEIRTVKPRVNYSDGGLFFVTGIEYQEQAGEWQIIVRYNDSTVRGIAEELGVTPEELGEEPFRYTLRSDSGETYEPYASVAARGSRHEFRRLAFRGVETDGCESLVLTVWYDGEVENAEAETAACGEIEIWGFKFES